MKKVMVEMFKCDHCEYTDKWESTVKRHEDNCHRHQAERKRLEEERLARVKAAREHAIRAAREDKALKVLIEAGLEDEALSRAKQVFDREVFYDFGSGYLLDQTLKQMVEAATI